MISLTSRLSRNADIIAAAVADETILLNASSWTYVHFNETATRIWECIGEPIRVSELISRLTAEYSVDESRCLDDIRDFTDEMTERGFVIVD